MSGQHQSKKNKTSRSRIIPTIKPAYNAKTGATTGKPSAEYNTYLKSLNKKSSSNYIPTPDDKGYENMDAINNAKITSSQGRSPLQLAQAIDNPVSQETFTNLRQGSQGEEVRKLQTSLQGAGFSPGLIDAQFGPKTASALKAYQTSKGLVSDAIFGSKTSASLYRQGGVTGTGTTGGATSPVATPTYTPSVGTSAQPRREKEIARIKAELKKGTEQPELYKSLEEFDQLRKELGIVKDEEELASIRNQARMAQEEMRIFKSQNAKEITQGGFTGAVSEAERNANFRLEGLALREQAVLDRVNAKNSYIQTALQLGQQDYNTAYQAYTNEYNKNLKAIDIYNAELDDQKKDALTGFQTISNLILESGMQMTPQLSTQLDLYALKAGLPIGVFQQALSGLQAKEKIDNLKIVGNNVYMMTTDSNGQPHLKLVQTISDGSVKGGADGQPIIDSSGNQLEYGTPEYVITRLKATSESKTKPVASEREQLGKFSNVVALTENLMGSLNKTTNDPIIGYLKSLNPYDFDARAVNAQVTALVPSVARALYGEVGVLTDTDIERYLKTLPNIKSTTDQNKFIAVMTLGNAKRSYEQTLLNLANSNVNVSGFVDSYRALTDKITQLESEIGVSKTTESEDIFNSVVGESESSSWIVNLWNNIF